MMMINTNISTTKKEHADAHDVVLTPFTIFRCTYSCLLLIFSITIVVALIFTGNTKLASDSSPWGALFICVRLRLISCALYQSPSNFYTLFWSTFAADQRRCMAFHD